MNSNIETVAYKYLSTKCDAEESYWSDFKYRMSDTQNYIDSSLYEILFKKSREKNQERSVKHYRKFIEQYNKILDINLIPESLKEDLKIIYSEIIEPYRDKIIELHTDTAPRGLHFSKEFYIDSAILGIYLSKLEESIIKYDLDDTDAENAIKFEKALEPVKMIIESVSSKQYITEIAEELEINLKHIVTVSKNLNEK